MGAGVSKSAEIFKRDAESVSNVMKLRFNPLVAERGSGAILWDADGREYLDFSAGWGVANTGYNHRRVVDAARRQMERLSFLSTISVINEESVLLAEELNALVPGDFEKKVWYGHSGSDANEFVAKMLPLASGRPRIISFTGSYHGQSMGAYGMSGHPAQSHFISGANVLKLPYPYCYRCAFQLNPDSCSLFCAAFIREYIFKSVCRPEQVAAVVIEAVQCDGGDVVPSEGFLRELRGICDEFGIYLVLDEVKIGFGHTGRFFGFQHWDIIPDLVVMGKPMGGGHPLSAVVGRSKLMDAGVGMHLFTTAGNPVACAAARETINVIRDERLTENAAETGERLLASLRRLQRGSEHIGDVRGKGLVIGVELVKDRYAKTPAPELAAMTAYRSFELGLLYYCAGVHSNVLELTPPLLITGEQADMAADIIARSLNDVLAGNIPAAAAEFSGWGV